MALNGISTSTYKADRQLAKLALAQAKRQGYTVAADGTITGTVDPTKPYYRERNSYDITELPTVYTAGDNDTADVFDNPNPDGLVYGRPWLSEVVIVEGLWLRVYSGDYTSDPTVIDQTPIYSAPVDQINIPVADTNTTYELKGYFRANWTGTWSFNITVDDNCIFWIGPSAQNPGINLDGNLINTGFGTVSNIIDLVEGNVYPIRILFSNGGGPGNLNFSWDNDLTNARVLALDATIDQSPSNIIETTDIGGYTAVLATPEVAKSTSNGGIITFNGTSSTGAGYGFANIFGSFNENFSPGMTVSVWAKITTGSGPWSRLIDFGNGPGLNNFLMGVYGDNPGQLFVSIYNGTYGINVPMASIPFDTWTLYTWTADGADYKLYYNDTLVSTQAHSELPDNVARNYCYIGGSNWSGDANLKGSVAAVEMYNRALTIDEIGGLFRERKGRFGL